MSFVKNLATGALYALPVLSGVALTERLVDPFDRHEHNYVLEGPQNRTEMFYMSTNWYDESGEKHDDRVSDALLGVFVTSSAGVILSRVNSASQAQVHSA